MFSCPLSHSPTASYNHHKQYQTNHIAPTSPSANQATGSSPTTSHHRDAAILSHTATIQHHALATLKPQYPPTTVATNISGTTPIVNLIHHISIPLQAEADDYRQQTLHNTLSVAQLRHATSLHIHHRTCTPTNTYARNPKAITTLPLLLTVKSAESGSRTACLKTWVMIIRRNEGSDDALGTLF